MNRSHTVLLSAVAIVIFAALAIAVWVRVDAPPRATLPASFSGQRATRNYEAADFSRVNVRGQWQVALVRGEAWSVQLDYPIELEPYVDANVQGDELVIALAEQPGWWSDFGRRGDFRTTARVVMPTLDELELAGASKLEMSGFAGNVLELGASGASTITATECRYDELDLDLAGAGNTDLSGLTATDARVSIVGAHSVTLRMAGGTLSGSMAGASSLKYHGSVASENVRTAGATSVRRLD
jgi:hypothetical protein